MENINNTNKMAYWLLTDIFSYSKESEELLFGGAGLISKDGIKKPSYFAFELLNKMGDELIEQGKGYMVTKKVGQRLQIILYHYTHFGAEEYFFDQIGEGKKSPSDIDNRQCVKFQFEINGVENGIYRKKYQRINKNTGSILDELSEFEKKITLREEEINYHRSVCLPSLEIEKLMIKITKLL